MVFTVSTTGNPNVRQVTQTFAATDTDALWDWVPTIEDGPGTYTITAQQGATTVGSATVTVNLRPTASGPNTTQGLVTAIRTVSPITRASVSEGDGIRASVGETFDIVLTGFFPGEQIPMYLYGNAGCASGQACFISELTTVTADGQGQASFTWNSAGSGAGAYVIVTAAEAQAVLDGTVTDLGTLRARIDLQ